MAQYIDKSALVAEIERRRDAALMRQRNLEAIGQVTVLDEMVANQLNRILSFINNLEVKDVGLEKDVRQIISLYYEGIKYYYEWDAEKKELKKIEQEPYPETLDKAIDLYYYTYGNGREGFEHLSLEQFKDIVKTFVDDYGMQKHAWSEEDKDYYDAIIAKLEVTQDDASLTDNQMKFLKSLKDKIQSHTKQKWNKEDEYVSDKLLNLIALINPTCSIFEGLPKERFIGRLKSIVQRLKEE